MYAWHDVYAGVTFVSIGTRKASYHIWLANGVGLRFDEKTHACIGFVILTGIPYDRPVQLPLWAVFTLMADELPPGAMDKHRSSDGIR